MEMTKHSLCTIGNFIVKHDKGVSARSKTMLKKSTPTWNAFVIWMFDTKARGNKYSFVINVKNGDDDNKFALSPRKTMLHSIAKTLKARYNINSVKQEEQTYAFLSRNNLFEGLKRLKLIKLVQNTCQAINKDIVNYPNFALGQINILGFSRIEITLKFNDEEITIAHVRDELPFI